MRLKISVRKGLGFGLTSGIITTLGLIIGLNAGTGSRLVVMAGILTIAIADAFSDAMGVHISEESGRKSITKKEVWESTLATFLSKFIFALIFIIPILLLELQTAVVISIIMGIFLITIFSYYIAKVQETSASLAIFEHLLITIFVIIATHLTGTWIARIF